MATKPTRRTNLPRPTETGVTISIGLMNTVCSLHPIQDTSNTRAVKLITLDPGHHRVGQFYVCDQATITHDKGNVTISGGCEPPADQPGFKVGDLHDKGRERGKGQPVVVLSADEVAATKASSLTPGLLQLELRPADRVAAETWPYGTAYWIEPDRVDDFYLSLCKELAEGYLAGVGTINLRDNDKFVRLLPHNGGLVMQQMLRPSDTWHFEPVEGEVSEKVAKMAKGLFEALTEDWDPDAFNSDRVAAMQALLAAKAGGEPTATVTPLKAPEAPQDSIEAQLAASLAMAMAAKAARKAS